MKSTCIFNSLNQRKNSRKGKEFYFREFQKILGEYFFKKFFKINNTDLFVLGLHLLLKVSVGCSPRIAGILGLLGTLRILGQILSLSLGIFIICCGKLLLQRGDFLLQQTRLLKTKILIVSTFFFKLGQIFGNLDLIRNRTLDRNLYRLYFQYKLNFLIVFDKSF